MATKFFLIFVFLFSVACANGQNLKAIITGADQPEKYLPFLENKKTALVVNNTSIVDNTHLADFLISKNINVEKIFAPEHGFRGDASAGEIIKDGIDKKTGKPVISLYGQKRKPTPEDLKGIDVVIFDIQDVGCRFYTYISTLHYIVEACAENKVHLIVLDRPNPNGDYIAGPVLDKNFQSFVGMDPISIVHGCTVGELALMIEGEHWHKASEKCNITIIQVKNYTHKMIYSLPVRPSPNLPNDLSVRLYPSLCFFEATSVSVGRGTDFPFQVIGGLLPSLGEFTFTPVDIPGVTANPLNEGKICYGVDLRKLNEIPKFTLKFFLDFYNKYERKEEFLIREKWMNTLSGTNKVIEQIRQGKSEKEIVASWQPELERYSKIRKKYLLYPDFE